MGAFTSMLFLANETLYWSEFEKLSLYGMVMPE